MNIDKNLNIYFNGGKTGLVAVGFHGMANNVEIYKGEGEILRKKNGKTHHITNAAESVLWSGNRSGLNDDLIKSLLK